MTHVLTPEESLHMVESVRVPNINIMPPAETSIGAVECELLLEPWG